MPFPSTVNVMLNLSILTVSFNGFTGLKLTEITDVWLRKANNIHLGCWTLFLAQLSEWEKAHLPKPDNLKICLLFADSKKNRS